MSNLYKMEQSKNIADNWIKALNVLINGGTRK